MAGYRRADRAFSIENAGLDYERLARELVKAAGVDGARQVLASYTAGGHGGAGGVAEVRGGGVGDVVRGSDSSGPGGSVGGVGVGCEAEVVAVVNREKGKVVEPKVQDLSDRLPHEGFGRIPESEHGDDTTSERSFRTTGSGGSVSGGTPPPVSDHVKKSVTFGTLREAYVVEVAANSRPTGYFGLTGTRRDAKLLAAELRVLCGHKVPKSAMVELGICTYAAGVMPAVVADGVARLRSLAAIGDAAITLHLVTSAYGRGESVSSAQSLRSKLTSNAYLRSVMVKNDLVRFVTYPAGVHPESATTTATAFEAIVGTMVQYMPVEAVAQFLRTVEIVK